MCLPPIPLPLLTQVTLSFLPKSCLTVLSCPTTDTCYEMERRNQNMMLIGSVFTKFGSLYELGDGTPMFTFVVKPTDPSPVVGGLGSIVSQVVPPDKKKRTNTSGSAVSVKSTSTKSLKSFGVVIVKTLAFSGQWTTIVAPRVRALKDLRDARCTASWSVLSRGTRSCNDRQLTFRSVLHVCQSVHISRTPQQHDVLIHQTRRTPSSSPRWC
jgi:hypothetical protein